MHADVREGESGGLEPLPETTGLLLSATERVVEDERVRGQILDTKTAQLTGLTGVVLALDATLGRAAFGEKLGSPYETIFPILYLVAIAALATAAIAAVIGVLLPQKTRVFERSQVPEFADGDLVLAEPIPIQRTLIRTYALTVQDETKRNNTKAICLQIAAWALAIGFLAVAGQAGTLGVREL